MTFLRIYQQKRWLVSKLIKLNGVAMATLNFKPYLAKMENFLFERSYSGKSVLIGT